MVTITKTEAPKLRAARVDYTAIVSAAKGAPGEWLAIGIEGRTSTQLNGIAAHLKKSTPLLQANVTGTTLKVCFPKTEPEKPQTRNKTAK